MRTELEAWLVHTSKRDLYRVRGCEVDLERSWGGSLMRERERTLTNCRKKAGNKNLREECPHIHNKTKAV